MKKIINLLILVFVSIGVQILTFLPWWSFLVSVFILGIVLPLEKWRVSSFRSGFVAGFLVWFLSTLYFEVTYKGEIINKMIRIISVSNFVIYIIIGCIGGLLTGLAFYSGFLLRKGKERLYLESPKTN
jgi:hypothetical protein